MDVDILRVYLDDGDYPHKVEVLSVYDRFATLDNCLDPMHSLIAATCQWHLLRVTSIAAMLKGQPNMSAMDPPGDRKLLKEPCDELGVEYDELMADFDALSSYASTMH